MIKVAHTLFLLRNSIADLLKTVIDVLKTKRPLTEEKEITMSNEEYLQSRD